MTFSSCYDVRWFGICIFDSTTDYLICSSCGCCSISIYWWYYDSIVVLCTGLGIVRCRLVMQILQCGLRSLMHLNTVVNLWCVWLFTPNSDSFRCSSFCCPSCWLFIRVVRCYDYALLLLMLPLLTLWTCTRCSYSILRCCSGTFDWYCWKVLFAGPLLTRLDGITDNYLLRCCYTMICCDLSVLHVDLLTVLYSCCSIVLFWYDWYIDVLLLFVRGDRYSL